MEPQYSMSSLTCKTFICNLGSLSSCSSPTDKQLGLLLDQKQTACLSLRELKSVYVAGCPSMGKIPVIVVSIYDLAADVVMQFAMLVACPYILVDLCQCYLLQQWCYKAVFGISSQSLRKNSRCEPIQQTSSPTSPRLASIILSFITITTEKGITDAISIVNPVHAFTVIKHLVYAYLLAPPPIVFRSPRQQLRSRQSQFRNYI